MDQLLGSVPVELTLADVVEGVFEDLHASIPRAKVAITVRRCRRELDISGRPAEPEAIRTLAVERLRSRRYALAQKSHRTGATR